MTKKKEEYLENQDHPKNQDDPKKEDFFNNKDEPENEDYLKHWDNMKYDFETKEDPKKEDIIKINTNKKSGRSKKWRQRQEWECSSCLVFNTLIKPFTTPTSKMRTKLCLLICFAPYFLTVILLAEFF